MKRVKNLRNMSTEELKKRLQDIDATLMQLKMFLKAKGGVNRGEIYEAKKQKARILTILRERELSIERGR